MTAIGMMADATPTDSHEAFALFDTLLMSIARGLTINRSDAMVYAQCQSRLLDSAYRDRLPGFCVQCTSILKFREFISLYDGRPAAREAFVRSEMARCRTYYEQRDIARPAAPRPGGSRDWTL